MVLSFFHWTFLEYGQTQTSWTFVGKLRRLQLWVGDAKWHICSNLRINEREEPAASHKWTGWVWEITGWSSENIPQSKSERCRNTRISTDYAQTFPRTLLSIEAMHGQVACDRNHGSSSHGEDDSTTAAGSTSSYSGTSLWRQFFLATFRIYYHSESIVGTIDIIYEQFQVFGGRLNSTRSLAS
jgi:hypothetical protein